MMTPREEIEKKERDLVRRRELAANWHHPLSKGSSILHKTLDTMREFKLVQEDVPLVVKHTENPNYFTSKLFTGAVDLYSHDCIHVLLGRGLLVKDEAFVIGYTMGSGKKMSRWRRNLFLWVTKYLYPEGYKFTEEERYIFYSGVMAGSQCSADLSKADCFKLKNFKIDYVRKLLNIDKKLLKYCYEVERKCFPDSPESQRLL